MRVQHRNETIRLADLAAAFDVVKEHDFENCLLIGPAVCVLAGDDHMRDSTFGGSLDDIFWEIEADRQVCVGAIILVSCRFQACRFDRVGFAGSAMLKMEMGMGITDAAAKPEAEGS